VKRRVDTIIFFSNSKSYNWFEVRTTLCALDVLVLCIPCLFYHELSNFTDEILLSGGKCNIGIFTPTLTTWIDNFYHYLYFIILALST